MASNQVGMLAWTHVLALLEQGREITDQLEQRLKRRDELRDAEDEAFSLGNQDESQRIAKEHKLVLNAISSQREKLDVLLGELTNTAGRYIERYNQEVAEQAPSMSPLPLAHPERIQEYRQFFVEIEKTVLNTRGLLCDWRRERLKEPLEEVRRKVEVLKSLGASVSAIEEFVDSEAYLDLPVEEAMARLQQELTLLETMLEEATQVRAVRAIEDLEQCMHLADLPAEALALAIQVLSGQDSALIGRFWQAIGPRLAGAIPAAAGMVAAHLEAAAGQILACQTDEDLPTWVGLVDRETFSLLDHLLAERAVRLDKAALHLYEEVASDTNEAVARLVLLKRYLPSYSFLVLEHLPILLENRPALYRWFVAPPREWPGSLQAMAWLGDVLEGHQRWAEAYICRCLPGGGTTEAVDTCLLIALAATHDACPASEDAWSTIVAQHTAAFRTERVALVAAVATLEMAGRLGLESLHILESLRQLLPSFPVAREALTAIGDVWPQPLAEALLAARPAAEQRDIRREIETFLQTPRTPAGGPSRNFYCRFILPALQRAYRQDGFAGLINISSKRLIQENLVRAGLEGLNPKAINITTEWIEEVKDLARQARELPPPVPASQEEASLADLRRGLADEHAKYLDGAALSWAYGQLHRLFSAGAESATASDSPQRRFRDFGEALRMLFGDSPAFHRLEPSDANLWWALLEELSFGERAWEWRIRFALEHKNFAQAQEYLAALPSEQAGPMERLINQHFAAATGDAQDYIALLADSIDCLEQDDEVAVLRDDLAQARSLLDSKQLQQAQAMLDQVIQDYTRIEREQQETRERLLTETCRLLQEGFTALLTGHLEADPMDRLLVSLIHQARRHNLSAAHRVALAIGGLFEGLAPDPELLAAAEAPPPTSEEPVFVPTAEGPEREPVKLPALPKLVFYELERALSPAREGGGAPSYLGREYSTKTLKALGRFRTAYQQGLAWEEPLWEFLSAFAEDCFRERNFQLAGQFLLGATQVAYHGASRFSRSGVELTSSSALNYVFCNYLNRLRLSGHTLPAQPRLFRRAPTREWVELIRQYLITRANQELVDVLVAIHEAAPDLLASVIEVPLSEVAILRTELIKELLADLEQAGTGGWAVLCLATAWGLDAADARAVDEFLSQLRAYVVDAAKADEQRPVQPTVTPEALMEQAASLPVPGQLQGIFLEALRSFQEGRYDPGRLEVNVSAITKRLYVTSQGPGSQIPLYIRLGLAERASPLRDLVISLKANHPWLKIAPDSRSIELPALGKNPEELRCMVLLADDQPRGRGKGSASSQAVSDLLLEVTDVALREGGIIKSGAVELKRGRSMKVEIVPTYPHEEKPNPFTPGPAVKDLDLIKGWDAETREVLRTLRGKHQDNVPLIWGARRIGKSTLLYKLALDADVRRHYEAVHCDMEGLVRSDDSTARFLQRLAKHVNKQLAGRTKAGRVPVPDLRGAEDTLDLLQDYLDAVAKELEPRSLLLMFDEMELFLDTLEEHKRRPDYGDHQAALHEDIIKVLRHNMQHKKNISFLLAGTHRLVDHTKQVGERLFHLPVPIKIDQLREPEARALLVEPVGGMYEYSTQAQETLLWLTAQHPYLLQAVCHEIFAYMQDHKRSVCSLTELNTVIEDRVMVQHNYFQFQTFRIRRTEERRLVAMAIAGLTREQRRTRADDVTSYIALRFERALAPGDIAAILKEFVDEEILKIWHKEKEYRFVIPLVGQYLNRENAHV